jgi:hypothetical protein
VPCRGCGYNLRGLDVPRCPECGASTFVLGRIRREELAKVTCRCGPLGILDDDLVVCSSSAVGRRVPLDEVRSIAPQPRRGLGDHPLIAVTGLLLTIGGAAVFLLATAGGVSRRDIFTAGIGVGLGLLGIVMLCSTLGGEPICRIEVETDSGSFTLHARGCGRRELIEGIAAIEAQIARRRGEMHRDRILPPFRL